jgi:hypothetical protein
LGPRPWGQLALHADDDPSNTRISNIAWGTHADNAADARRNRALAGEGSAEIGEHA